MNILNLFGKSYYGIRNWNSRSAKKFACSKQSKLIINRNLKWKGPNNYDFLLEVKDHLRDLKIIDFSERVDISSLKNIALENLALEIGAKCVWPDSWPDSLKEIKINMTRKTPDLTSLPALEKITIWGSCNWERLPSFSSPCLKFVSVDSRTLKKLFSDYHESVKSLEISGCKDLSLEGLKFCPNLKNLDLVDISGKVDISHVSQLPMLERLAVDGDRLQVDSLAPLSGMNSLNWVFLGNTKVNDGKISIMGKIPTLKKIAFNDKRGNDITLQNFLEKFHCEHI